MDNKKYFSRLVDERIDEYLEIFGAVCIEGPKWCGKTSSAYEHAKSSFYLGAIENNFLNKQLTLMQPDYALKGESPRLIDEWQEVPALWDAVRSEVDKTNRKGQYILTGSSTPTKKGILHSGAGRIGTIKMRPMSLYESKDSSGEISLKDVCEGKFLTLDTGHVNLEKIVSFVVRGGWPGCLDLSAKQGSIIAKSYIDRIINEDFSKFDGVKRLQSKMKLLLKSLARNDCTLVTNKKIQDDCAFVDNDENSEKANSIDKDVIADYLDCLNRLFLLDNLEPFSINVRSSLRVKQQEKRRFVDPSLTVALLGLTEEKLIKDLNTLGFLFESLVIRDLLVYAESFDAKVYHYNDYNNDEIDAIISLSDDSWCAFEIKLGAHKIDEAAESLIKISNKLVKNGEIPPKVLCVICATTQAAYLRADGVYVMPITALKN